MHQLLCSAPADPWADWPANKVSQAAALIADMRPFQRFIVAKGALFCHKPGLHRPAHKRAAVAMTMRVYRLGENHSIYNALTSILAGKRRFGGGFFCGNRRAKCPS